jgi:hypothetical protein
MGCYRVSIITLSANALLDRAYGKLQAVTLVAGLRVFDVNICQRHVGASCGI